MGIPANIDDLINFRTVESNRIEFKADFNPNPIIHTICAFANDIDNIGGGYIIVGVEEHDGVPVLPVKGLEQADLDGILKRFVGFCHCIEPLYNPIVEPVLFHDAWVIVIWVPGGHGRPYKASKDVFTDKAHKLYYIRRFSSTIVASPEEERHLFYASSDIPFDDRPNLLAMVGDLSLPLMREHLKEIGSSLYEQSSQVGLTEMAENLQLLSGPPEDMHPRNVGILMFCDHPERFFRYARIEVVDMPDATGEGMTEQVFTGPIQWQLKQALLYIKNYIIKTQTSKNPQEPKASVVSNYPFAAVEELLANAVYHRSYQVNEPITVRVTPEELEITSFPGFDWSIVDRDIELYKIRSRIYRNRRIGDFLKELHLIEGRNTGFPTALAALERNGSPKMRFEMDANRAYLSVILPVHPAFLPGNSRKQADVDYEQRILNALEAEPLSLTELSVALGYKSIPKRLSTKVEEMIAAGSLVRVPGVGNRTKLSSARATSASNRRL